MARTVGLRVAVTGAAGFIGRALIERIERGALDPLGSISELRLNDLQGFYHPAATVTPGSYADPDVRKRIVGDGIDVLFHLASLPGGAAQLDPALGKAVNLDGSIALLDAVSVADAPRVVYASSIAALGAGTDPVNASTALRPAGSYGTHKAMIEFYLADLTRRGLVDGRSVRPAGIVARPRAAYGGFATAWMSELFHAAREGSAMTIPARADAHVWLQSVDAVADNIIHAALMPAEGLSPGRAWTLPATVAEIGSLIHELALRTGQIASVECAGGAIDHPPLDATDATAIGFTSDGDTAALVNAVVSRLERSTDEAIEPWAVGQGRRVPGPAG